MGLFTDAFTGYDDPSGERYDRLKGLSRDQGRQTQDLLNDITKRGEDLSDQPMLTAQDLFGGEIQNLEDNARASSNATKQAISRGMMAGGQSGSGQATVNMLRGDQQLQGQIGNINNRFNSLAMQLSQQQQQRGDSLINRALRGTQSERRTNAQLLDQIITRNAQKQQAAKERSSGFWGGLLKTGGTIAGAAIAACWVAEELYGDDQEAIDNIRDTLTGAMNDDTPLGEFARSYRLHGDQWARMVRANPELRYSAGRAMRAIHENSKT
jgi:hypothetical protein